MRTLNSFALLVCLALLAGAGYLQYGLGIEPCALCMAQRLLFILIGVTLIFAVLHNPRTRAIRLYGLLLFIISLLGTAAASRQIWLQTQPPKADALCLPGFNYMLQHLPLSETLKYMVVGTGDCGIVTWTFLGLSTPAWSLIFFVVFLLLSLWHLFCRVRPAVPLS